jgi:hypothetical protein
MELFTDRHFGRTSILCDPAFAKLSFRTS